MAMPRQEEIDMFIDITHSNEAIAVQRLRELGGDINEALYAYFNPRSSTASSDGTSVAVPRDDIFDDANENPYPQHQMPLSPLSSEGDYSPCSIIDLTVDGDIFDAFSGPTNQSPSVTKSGEVRETPIDVMDWNQYTPIIEKVTRTVPPAHHSHQDELENKFLSHTSLDGSFRPVALSFQNPSDGSDDIEEQMMRAAMETSRQEYERSGNSGIQEALDLDLAISLSITTAEQQRAQRLQEDVRAPIVGPPKSSGVELGKLATSNGRLQEGSSFFQDEAEDAEEQPLIRNTSRHIPLDSADLAQTANVSKTSTLSSLENQGSNNHPQHNGNYIHEEERCGIFSVNLNNALLKDVMFGGRPEGSSYDFPNDSMQNKVSYLQLAPRPPLPSLKTQSLIREQQEDECVKTLREDIEKELRTFEEARAAWEEERRGEEESHKKLQEEKELVSQLAAKEAALPPEPSSHDENAVALQVKMPDGSHRGRKFLKSDNLQSLFDFIDIGREVKPGTYRFVTPYLRHAFSDGERSLTLNEIGLTEKQETLFLELI